MSRHEAALDLLAGLTLESGARWGDAAEPWQWEDARALLDPASSTPYSFMSRGRGGSKTTDLAGVVVAAMLAQAPAAARLYGLAADRDQGRLLIDAISGFRARTPELAGALEVGAYRVTAARSGATLDVIAADAPSAWGLLPWFVIVDELAQWAATPGPRLLWEAVTSAVAKLDDARLAVLTSAGDPAHWSRKVLEHALADPLWRVHEVPGPVPWLDEERLAEQRRRLPESSYRRLFLNEWTASEDRLVAPDDLAAAAVLDGPLAPEPTRRYVIGLDIGLTNDATVAAVVHGETMLDPDAKGEVGTRIVLDRLEVWQGTRAQPVDLSDVEAWIDLSARSYNHASVVFDPWQAVHLTQRLRSRGVRIVEFTFSAQSVGRLASTLHQLLRSRTISLPDDPELLDELANVRLVERTPGVHRIEHDADKHDDRAIALALAAFGALHHEEGGGRQYASYDGGGEPVTVRGDLILRGERYIDKRIDEWKGNDNAE